MNNLFDDGYARIGWEHVFLRCYWAQDTRGFELVLGNVSLQAIWLRNRHFQF